MLTWLRNMKAAAHDVAEASRLRRDLRSFGRTAPKDEDRLVSSYDRQMARARCHDLRRNNPVVAGIGDRFADYVVHGGIRPQSQTSDEAWNQQADAWFENWSQIADARERLTLDEICRMAVTSRLFDGESFHLLLDSGKIMPIEAERCRSPKAITTGNEAGDGVAVDSLGRVRSYCFHGRDKSGVFDGEHDWRWYAAQDVIHVARPWRYDSIRPMPELSPIANVIADMQELNTATLSTAKLQAMVGLIINKMGGAANPNFGFRTANGTTKTAGYPDLRRIENMMILEGEQGDTIQGLDLKSPGSNYAPFMRLQLQWIGACLGLPYEFVMMVFEGTSFSGSKALMTQAGRTVENWQFWLIDNFLQPLRTWRIAKAIKEGRLPAAPVDSRGVSEWYKCTWQPPPMDWIDPAGQMQTDIQEYLIGATDLATIGRRRGRSWREVALSKARELSELDSIAEQHGVKRSDLSFFQLPGATSVTSQPPTKDEQTEEEEKDMPAIEKKEGEEDE